MKKIIVLLCILIGCASLGKNAQASEACSFKPLGKNKYNVVCTIILDHTATYSESDIDEIKFNAEAELRFSSADFAIKNKQTWFLVKGIKLKHIDSVKAGAPKVTSSGTLTIGNSKMPKGATNAKTFIQSAN